MPFLGRGEYMEKRSTANVVVCFIVFPPLVALLMLGVMCKAAWEFRDQQTTGDVIGFVLVSILLLTAALGLPAVGWREVRKRREVQKK